MNLSEMTVTELRKLAAQHKIAGRSSMKKAELIDALSIETDETPVPAPVAYGHVAAPAKAQPTRTKALITRDIPGAAFFNLSNGIGGVIVRYGRVFELVTSSGETITVRARTMVKAVKRLAVKLGIHLDTIDTVKVF